MTSFDGRKLDCMFIKADNKDNAEFNHKPQSTILFCNPNACFYEYLHYQTEWIDYYHNLGVNIVIWNYREYSRSGKPATFF